MPAYIVGQISITDPEAYGRYREKVPAIIEKCGGRYLTRGGPVETLEGLEFDRRMVVIEFPDMEMARAFYFGPDYAPVKAIRLAASEGQLLLQEGV